MELKGATFFDVAHNADKPFRILTGTYQITVLGTRFNVMAYPESKRFEIDLVEGSVQVNNANDPTDQLILCPHEQAILRNNRLWRQASEFDNEEYLKNGIVSFKSRPFGEILDNVALWQGVRFTVEKDVDIQKSVTGKFRQSDSLESILRVLQSIADFRYKIIDEKTCYHLSLTFKIYYCLWKNKRKKTKKRGSSAATPFPLKTRLQEPYSTGNKLK